MRNYQKLRSDSLFSWNKVVLEKMTVALLAKKVQAFYGT